VSEARYQVSGVRCQDRPGDLALEACRLLAEWAADHRDPLPDGLPVVLGAAEDALEALAESEGG
jgi:hypothetical protein